MCSFLDRLLTKVVGRLEPNITPEQAKSIDESASVDIVKVTDDVKGTGVGQALYKAFHDAYEGNVSISGKTSPDAWKVWKRDYPEKVNEFVQQEATRLMNGADREQVLSNITDPQIAQRIVDQSVAREASPSQTLASVDTPIIPPEARTPPVDTVAEPRSAANIDKKEELRQTAAAMPIKTNALREYMPIKTMEEALRLSEGTKDITKNIGQKALNSGINFSAALTKSPALRYASTVLRDARTAAEKFSRDYITDKGGMSPLWRELKSEERIATMEALMAGDREQYKLTPKVMEELGFNEKQKAFAEKFYEADNVRINRWNEVLKELGYEPIKAREGHFPGVFQGAYKTLVMKDNKVAGVIAVDTAWQRSVAKKWFEKNQPDHTMIDQPRKGLSGNNVRSDMFSGMNDVMQILAKNDPRFAEVQSMVSDAVKNANNNLFNFNVHELQKKGVVGNEGNKPWLDRKANSEDAFKSLIRYFEEGALHNEMQLPVKNLRELATSPEMQHLPNTTKELNAYLNHVTGQGVSPIGTALNIVVDTPGRLLGIGSSPVLRGAGAIKNRMSQQFMGVFNWLFTAAQGLQPIQMGMPLMQMAANRLGMGAREVSGSMMNGTKSFIAAFIEESTGKKTEHLSEDMRQAFKYAKDRGLYTFSEMERAYEGTQSKVMNGIDKAAEFNMSLGERGTRTPMFMSFVDMLRKGGIDMEYALPMAENLTQVSMIDYHAWERPRMYSSLGVAGQFAGGLTTFKHAYMGNKALLGKEAKFWGDGEKNIKPLMLSSAAAFALAGITGTPFYDEADQFYGFLTDKFTDSRKTIRETVLKNLPEWANSGAISTASNINVQSKFSAADMVPNNLGQAMSPQLAAFGGIIGNMWDAAKNHDEQSFRNLLLSISPASLRGYAEDKFAKNDKGQLIGKEGLPVIDRTEKEWNTRKYTSARPQTEVITRDKLFNDIKKMAADKDAQKKISGDYKRALINGTMTDTKQAQLFKDYQERKGDVQNLIKLHQEAAMEQQQTEKQRVQGIPSGSQSSVNKFNYFNK